MFVGVWVEVFVGVLVEVRVGVSIGVPVGVQLESELLSWWMLRFLFELECLC